MESLAVTAMVYVIIISAEEQLTSVVPETVCLSSQYTIT